MTLPYRSSTTTEISNELDSRYETPGGAQNKVDISYNELLNLLNLAVTGLSDGSEAAIARNSTPYGITYAWLKDRLDAADNRDISANQQVLNAETKITNNTHRNLRVQQASLPNMFKMLTDYLDNIMSAINVVGFGSSVGNGATLPDPSTQAPSAYFKLRVDSVFNKLGNLNIQHYNHSVDGSIVADLTTAYATAVAASHKPKVALLSYGMNDGTSAQYHANQTYSYMIYLLKDAIKKMRKDGVDPIICTTPHPHSTRTPWTMPGGVSVIYPAAGVMVPNETLAQSVKTIDALGDGNLIPVSYRHYRVNEAMRKVAAEMLVPIIDVEKYWFEAVAAHGEDALFDTGQYVHPNLLGHQLSYHAAIDDFITGLGVAYLQSSQTDQLGKKIQDGEFLNVDAGSSKVITTLADSQAGTLTLEAEQSGVSDRCMKVYNVLGNRTAIVLSQVGTTVGSDIITLSTSGMDLIVTPTYSNTHIRYLYSMIIPEVIA
ncbi:hypothetical protein D3C81_174010 [compost metagenome]